MSGTIARPFLCIPRDFMTKGFSHQEIGWFMDLISRAQYTKQTVVNGGREQTLLPGQLCDAVSFFVDRWKVTRDKVMRFIKKLVAFSYLSVEKPAHQSKKAANVITVCHLTGKPRSEVSEEDGDAHQPHINRTSTAHKYKKGEGNKKDSPVSPQGDAKAYDGSFPGDEEAAGAGPSESPPQPEQQADPSPNSAAPSPRKPRAKREAKPAAPPPPEDWKPSEKTIARLIEGRGISRRQVELQAERFVNQLIANDNRPGYVRFDAALINWVMGSYYKEIPEMAPQVKPKNYHDAYYADVEEECPA